MTLVTGHPIVMSSHANRTLLHREHGSVAPPMKQEPIAGDEGANCLSRTMLSVQEEPTGGEGRVVGWFTSAAVTPLATSICLAA